MEKIEILEGQEFIMNGQVFKWNSNGVGITIMRVGFVPAVFGKTSIVKKKVKKKQS